MSLTIQRLMIRGLHGARNYNIEVRDNRIVMVGVNGLGKTTVVNLLYLILSRQWDRALQYEFESIEISINGREYTLKQGGLQDPASQVARQLRVAVRRL
jgi:predicted ATP-binding protein involved in virulence